MLVFSPGMGLMIFHFARSSNSPFTCSRVAWSILDCAHRTMSMLPPSLLVFPLLEEHSCWSKCGRRTRPFSGRAFREHRTNVGALPLFHRACCASIGSHQASTFHPSSKIPPFPIGEWPRLPFTAHIERYVCSLQACLFAFQRMGAE
jgi:hypothetical protein